MSLQDESFPADDLFDQLNNTKEQSLGHYHNIAYHEPKVIVLEHITPPFSNSDFSEDSYTETANTSGKTCASDPVGLEDADTEHGIDKNELDRGHTNPQLSTGRSSKAVSYQDIHSAYTKRRFKHVASKVGQYIAAINAEDQQRRSAASKFQRHRSLPETFTLYSSQEVHTLNESSNNSSEGEPQQSSDRDDSYERLLNENELLHKEKERLKDYNDHIQSRLDEKIGENLQLKRNFDVMRMELSQCKEKLRQYESHSTANLSRNILHASQSMLYCPISASQATQTCPSVVTKETQTELILPLPAEAHISSISNLSDLPVISSNATPNPNANLNNITYDSSSFSAGSIEVALLSIGPMSAHATANKNKKNIATIQPLSLNFSSDSADGNGETAAENSQPSRSNRITTNNSGSSHPSSNDSAIEVEGIEMRSPVPAPRYRHSDVQRERIYFYYNAHGDTTTSPRNLSANATQTSRTTNNTTVQIFRNKKTLRSRILRFFGPCVRCDDPNQSVDAGLTSYTEVPLLEERYGHAHARYKR